MALRVGTRLGPYEIVAPIGAGGMGDVYKADDTRLERTVAIKVLLEGLAGAPERRQRFEREAKAISKLNHPHICILHDVGREGGVDYLVLEYIEGETLADRLEKGPLRLEQALEYGIQMADGLDKAHRAGIVHRDLKPGNVMLTASGVKILDFGLAKPVDEPVVAEASAAPTRQKPLTGEDAIVGTLQYMAPEQLERKAVDERSDIFAFGAVLYEMITGKKAFVGESQASLIAAILEHEPASISRLQPMPPSALDRIVRKCLEKDPDKRWQSATDLRDELQWIADSGEQSGLAPSTPKRSWRWAVLAALVTASVAALITWNLTRSPPSANVVTRFVVPLEGYVSEDRSNLALSPDGSTVAYVAVENGVSQIYSRSLDRLEPEAIAGTEGASCPFFSPDGEWLGFNGRRAIKKIPLSGGTPTTLHDSSLLAASWVSDGKYQQVVVLSLGGLRTAVSWSIGTRAR